MSITGKKIFELVYVVNLVFHVIFIGYSWLQHNSIDFNYFFIAATSIIATTIIFLGVNKDKEEKNYE